MYGFKEFLYLTEWPGEKPYSGEQKPLDDPNKNYGAKPPAEKPKFDPTKPDPATGHTYVNSKGEYTPLPEKPIAKNTGDYPGNQTPQTPGTWRRIPGPGFLPGGAPPGYKAIPGGGPHIDEPLQNYLKKLTQ